MPKKGVDLKNFKLNIFVEPDEEDLFEYMIHMKRSLRKRGAAI